MDAPDTRLLIVSHPCVLAVNQAVYLAMKDSGWDPLIIVPDRWRHEYSSEAFPAQTLAGLEGSLRPVRVALRGRAQRHFYLAGTKSLIEGHRPAAVFLEQESFSIPALQWGVAAHRAGIPFGVQAAENLDRPLQRPAERIRNWVLRHATFVAARSPAAADLARAWGATGLVSLVPHAVPTWTAPLCRSRDQVFTIGFAGRLVPEKGLWDLVEAVRQLEGPTRLLLVGDGPLRPALAATEVAGTVLEIRTSVRHNDMAEAYAEMDVLVLPSHTTPRWAEQFGRVLVEALSCGVPVAGSDSGEIPWVISDTGGGVVFPERNVARLRDCLARLQRDPMLRARLAAEGHAAVERRFTADACGRALGELVTEAVRLRTGTDIHRSGSGSDASGN